MDSRRPHDWPDWLHAYLNSHRYSPFVWGLHDCCLFGANWLTLAIGQDLAAGLRGRYHDKESAGEIIASYGGLESMVTSLCIEAGLEEVKVPYAMRGDIVITDALRFATLATTEATVGIVQDDTAAFVHHVKGLVALPVEKCHRAWRVA